MKFQITIVIFSTHYVSVFDTELERKCFHLGVIEAYEMLGRSHPEMYYSMAG